jgi:hypothetical protein
MVGLFSCWRGCGEFSVFVFVYLGRGREDGGGRGSDRGEVQREGVWCHGVSVKGNTEKELSGPRKSETEVQKTRKSKLTTTRPNTGKWQQATPSQPPHSLHTEDTGYPSPSS